MPSVPVIVIASLAAAWGWMLGIPLIKSLIQRDRSDSVGDFNRQLNQLAKAPRRSLAVQRGQTDRKTTFTPAAWRAQPARSRRRQVFFALCISAVTSPLLSVAFGGIFWGLHIVMDVLLGAFVGLAARAGAIEFEQRQKVTYLEDYDRGDQDEVDDYYDFEADYFPQAVEL
jgi:hypothetical protein